MSSFPKFSGVRSDYFSWLNAILTFAQTASSVDPEGRGLLGFVLSPEAWAHDFPPEDPAIPEPFTPLVRPPGNVPTTSTLFDTWRYRMEQYTTQQKDLALFKTNLIGSLDPISYRTLEDPVDGFRRLPPMAILRHLHTLHATLTLADIHSLRASLSLPFVPGVTTLRDFISTHTRTHRLLADSRQPLDEVSKIDLLVQALTPCARYDQRIQLWSITTTDIRYHRFLSTPAVTAPPEQVTPAIPGFADALMTYDESNFAPSVTPPTTTGGLGLALPVTWSPPSPPIQQQLDLITQALHALSAAAPVPTAAKPKTKKTSHYCWTHVICAHQGNACRNKATGHQAQATARNKMGGKA